jgi:hypothetical protein
MFGVKARWGNTQYSMTEVPVYMLDNQIVLWELSDDLQQVLAIVLQAFNIFQHVDITLG